jgi:hypothetical protein
MNQIVNYRFKSVEIGNFKTSDASDCIKSFEKGCNIMGMTLGLFSLIDLIYVLLKKVGKSNVIVGTWSAGIKDAHQVKWMIESDLINDFKLLTDHSYVNRQKKYALSIGELFGEENIRTSEMHAKFVLISNKNYKIAIVSSMNLNANKTCELFSIHEGDDIFDFLNNFAMHHFDNMTDGFEPLSSRVNDCLNKYFAKEESNKISNNHWSEI